MDISRILAELEQERERIEKAIELLQTIGSTEKPSVSRSAATTSARSTASAGKASGGSRLSPEGRRKISEMMKKRWAERRRKAARAAR